jgi:hypothetical protein
VIKSRGIKLAGDAARMAEMRNVYKIFIKNIKGRDHVGDLVLDEGYIISIKL